jgi:hypothetical protein
MFFSPGKLAIILKQLVLEKSKGEILILIINNQTAKKPIYLPQSISLQQSPS